MSTWPRIYWMAGKRHEGCGHRHRGYATARACLARLERRGYRGGHVHRVTVRPPKGAVVFCRVWIRGQVTNVLIGMIVEMPGAPPPAGPV